MSLFLSVKFLMNIAELGIGDVGVDLGGGDGGMAEHGLDGADVGAVAQEIGGKTVTK